MAYLAAANVTVTLLAQDIEYVAGRIFTFPTVAFGDGALQYPALGIPMPVIAKFGMKKEIKRAFIEQPGNGFIYSFDRANQKLRIFLGAARDAITVANHVGVAPTGNVSAPAFTGDAMANITPTGNVAAPAFTGDAMANITPTGNVAAPAFTGDAMANITPAGNVAAPVFTGDAMANITPTGNVAAPAFTGDAMAPGTPTGNIANTSNVSGGTPTGNVAAPADHSHDLVVAANSAGAIDVDMGVNSANSKLVANVANAYTIPGGVAANGGVANAAIAAGAFTGDALGTHLHTSGAFTGDAMANITPTGNVAAPAFTGDAMAPGTPTGNVAAPAFTGDTMANLVHTVTGGGAVAEAALAEMDDGVAPAATTLYMQIIGQ